MKPRKEVTMVCLDCESEYKSQKSMVVDNDGNAIINPATKTIVLIKRLPTICGVCGRHLIRRTKRLTTKLTGMATLISYEGDNLIAKKFNKMKEGETWLIPYMGLLLQKRSDELKIKSTIVPAAAAPTQRRKFLKQFTLLAKQAEIRVTPK